MSLFDKDFKLTFEAAEEPEDKKDLQASEEKCEDCDEPKIKKDKEDSAKKDSDKKDDADDGEGEEPEEPTEADMKEAATLVDADLECDSLLEMRGPVAIQECEEDIHYLCLEAVGMQIAMDKTDQKLTEAYVVTESEEAKEEVKRSFKESLKRYWERFKGFMERVRLAIVRTAQRVWAYLSSMAAKVSAKIAAKGKYSTIASDATIKAPANITKSLKDLVGAISKEVSSANVTLQQVIAKPEVGDKDTVANLTLPNKDDILKNVLGEEKEIKCNSFGEVSALISTLKNCSKEAGAYINSEKEKINKNLNSLSATLRRVNDLDTAAMTVGIAAINKEVALYNRQLSVLTSVFVAWLGARTKALRAHGKATKESFDGGSLFEQFMAMTE